MVGHSITALVAAILRSLNFRIEYQTNIFYIIEKSYIVLIFCYCYCYWLWLFPSRTDNLSGHALTLVVGVSVFVGTPMTQFTG